MCVYVRECVCMHVYVRECVCVSERLRVYVSVWKSVWGKASVGGVWDDFSIQLFLACCSRPRTCRKKGGWKTHWKSHDATLAHTPCFKAVVILKHIIYWTCSKCRFFLFCIFTDILKCYVDEGSYPYLFCSSKSHWSPCNLKCNLGHWSSLKRMKPTLLYASAEEICRVRCGVLRRSLQASIINT